MTDSTVRVLVVDDDETVLLNLAAYFEDEGFEVLAARSGEEALEFLAGGPVQVGVIDIRLPGIDGNDLIVKAHRLQPGMKFLVHTGSSSYELPGPLLTLGITRAQVFKKPISDMGVLVMAIRSLIREGKNERPELRGKTSHH